MPRPAAAPSALRPGLAVLVGVLLLLGVGAQLWLLYEMRYDLPVLLHDDPASVLAQLLMIFLPALLAVGGAVLGAFLGRRGSGWAFPAAGLPCALLLLGLGLAVYLTFNPILLHHH